jgi:predicted transcriptional regulator
MQQALLFAPKVSPRDRVYMVKDLMLKLIEYGELNQTALISFCGLNMKKHKPILDMMEAKGLVTKTTQASGKRHVAVYCASQKGLEFCRAILEPYEKMFPRKTSDDEKVILNKPKQALHQA